MPVDIAGQKYGRLLAVSPANGSKKWLFQCECGASVTTDVYNVLRGRTASCGCLKRDLARSRLTKHGQSVGNRTTPTRRAYLRLLDEAVHGISQVWMADFSAFVRDMGECPPGFRVARHNPDLPYTIDNCHYAPASQAKKSNIHVMHQGKRMILSEFARLMGVDYDRLYNFTVVRGMELSLAVDRIRAGKIARIEVNHEGRTLTLAQFARAMNVNYNMLKKRVSVRKMDPHSAVKEMRSISNQTRAVRPRSTMRSSAMTSSSQAQSSAKPQELHEHYRMRSPIRFAGLRDYTPAKQIHRCKATRRVLRALRDF